MTTLAAWNEQPKDEAVAPILACCGSRTFAEELVDCRPFADADALLIAAEDIWWSLDEQDWREAFACHPRIGESTAGDHGQFAAWSTEEQGLVRASSEALLHAIAEKNREYEARHGFLYIICASGKPAEELLTILDKRIRNSTAAEIKEAAEQQRKITQLRLRKWLHL